MPVVINIRRNVCVSSFMTVYYPDAHHVTRGFPSGPPVVSWGTDWSSVGSTLPGGLVADVENKNNGHQQGARSVEIRVPAQLENLAVVRTVVAAIGTFEDLDFDAVSDLRLAVDEACTRLVRSAVPNSTLVVGVHPTDSEVVVEVSTTCTTEDILTPGSFSWHVLSSLTDEVSTFQDGRGAEEGRVFGISMTTRRASSLR
jgi:serine/threonine-protein kinase RsbW